MSSLIFWNIAEYNQEITDYDINRIHILGMDFIIPR